MKSATDLIRRMLKDPEICSNGKIANDLLRQFHRGFAVENLRDLLLNKDDRIVKAAVFIASELGNKAAPLIDDVARLLSHRLMIVRYNAIDSMLTCATGEDDDVIGKVISLFTDSEGAIRRKVLDFLFRASESQITGGLCYFKKGNVESSQVQISGLEGLVGKPNWDADRTRDLIESEDPILRKYAVVAAARSKWGNEILEKAARSTDDDISLFARNVLEIRNM